MTAKVKHGGFMKYIVRFFAIAFCLHLAGAPWATAQWERLGGPPGGQIQSFAMNGSKLFAGTQDGVFLSTNEGGTWTPVDSGLTDMDVNALVVMGNGAGANIFAGTWNDGVFVSTNDGGNWTRVTNGMTDLETRCLAVSGTDLYAGTNDGLFRSTNYGLNWSAVNNGLVYHDICALAVIGSRIFAGAYEGGVYVSTNNGASWTATNTGLSNKYVTAMAVSGQVLYTATNGGGVFRSTNHGANWSEANNGITDKNDWSLIADGTQVVMGATSGNVFYSNNNATNWQARGSALSRNWVTALVFVGTQIFAGTEGDGILKTTDSGLVWATANVGIGNTVVSALAARGNTLIAGIFGTGGGTLGTGIFRSTDNGSNWMPSNLVNLVYCLMYRDSTLFMGTDGHGIYVSTNDGAGWDARDSGLTCLNVYALAARGSTIFAATNEDFAPWGAPFTSMIFMSTNDGASWHPVSWSMTQYRVYALALSPDSSRKLFAGTDSGMFRSTNNGSTWTAVDSGLPPDRISCLAYQRSKLFASAAGSGVYSSTNDGESWTAANAGLPNRYINCIAVRDTMLFAGTHSGVFFSTNGGTYWYEVNDGLAHKYVQCLAAGAAHLFAGTDRWGVWRRAFTDFKDVELAAFSARAIQDEALLEWRTASETNNAGFVVERARERNGEWEARGFVPGSGSASSLHAYRFTDRIEADCRSLPTLYYRLRQRDFDGTEHVSQTVEVSLSQPNATSLEALYPNPARQQTTVRFSLASRQAVRLILFDQLDRTVLTLVDEVCEPGSHGVSFSTEMLPAGIYFYRLQAGNFIEMKKLIVLR